MCHIKLRKITDKKGAIELSIGTVVIIVLAMSMLILGIILIRNIFTTAGNAVTEIDQGVKNEINRLFAAGRERTLILYPDSKVIEVERGSSGSGFVVALGNKDQSSAHQFSYTVAFSTGGTCTGTPPQDVTMIAPGQGTDFTLPAKDVMENPIHITFQVPQTADLCNFVVEITPQIDGADQAPGYMTVNIIPE